MNLNLTAPLYKPAASYQRPTPAPFDFNADTVSIEELMTTPATRSIVSKYTPWVGLMYGAEAFKPHAANFTLKDAATFFPGDHSKEIAAADAALKQIPPGERPANAR
jgi:hypothetical protein